MEIFRVADSVNKQFFTREGLLFLMTDIVPVVDATTTAKKTNKKRNRAKPKSLVAGPGVCVLGDRFVCSYSAQIRTHAIFVPGVDSVCFANIPCAFAWLEENVKNNEELLVKLKQATADEYQQPLESIERAPARETLSDFGGKLYYVEWFATLLFWDTLTESNGTTVAEYKNRNSNTAVKRGKGAQSKVAFEAAMYVVGHGGGAGKCKKINGLDGVAVDDGATKALLTPVRAQRKLTNFISSHLLNDSAQYQRKYVEKDNYIGVVLVTAGVADEKLHNHVATELAGENCYGPAVFTFTRKHNQKI